MKATVEAKNLSLERAHTFMSMDKYPKAMDSFQKWLGFWIPKSAYVEATESDVRTFCPFHLLPFEMQEGILRQFLQDQNRGYKFTPLTKKSVDKEQKFIVIAIADRFEDVIPGSFTYYDGYIAMLEYHLDGIEKTLKFL